MSLVRSRWAAVGAAVAVSLGAGGIGFVDATVSSGDRAVFVPIEPCRIADTRPTKQVGPKASPVGPGETHDIHAWGPSGECNIPSDATALSLNVTALSATQNSFMTIWGDGDRPKAASLNPIAGAGPVPNAVNTPLTSGGVFNVYNSAGSVHVVIDVNGYYADHNHDDRYYTKSQSDSRYSTTAQIDAAIAGAASNWIAQIPLGSLASTTGTSYNSSGFSGPIGLELAEASARLSGNVILPQEYQPGTSVHINLDVAAGSGSAAPCGIDLDMYSSDGQLARPGSGLWIALARDTSGLDVTIPAQSGSIVRATVVISEGAIMQPGDSLSFSIIRSPSTAADSCGGDIVVTGMSLTPAG